MGGKFTLLIFMIYALAASQPSWADELAPRAAPTLSADDQKTTLAVEALTRLQNVNLEQNAKLKETVLKVLERTRGSPNFVKLVQQFKLPNEDAGLLDVALRNSSNETGVEAIRLVFAHKNFALVQETLRGSNTNRALQTAELLGIASDKDAVQLLSPVAQDKSVNLALRRQAVRSLARTADGATELLMLAKAGKLPEDLKFTASSELSRARWPEIKEQATQVLPLPAARNSQPLPSISELLRMNGDPTAGERVFNSITVGCATCHRVKGQGIDFGPDLSEIGTKLGKDALVEAILDPSAGISFGFEAFQLELKSGDEVYGLIASETGDEIAIKAVGGIISLYKKSEVTKREQMKLSIMPAGLQQNMSTQDLVDLVEYLASLKKPQ